MDFQEETNNALSWYQSGDLQNAKRICEEILVKNPKNGEILYFLGVIYSQLKQHDPAIKFLKESLEFFPDNADAYHLLGMSYQQQEQIDEAIECYRKTIKYNPNYAEAYNNLANALKEKNNVEEAIVYYKKAIDLQPALAIAHYNLGFAYEIKRDYDEALASYKKALKFDPNNYTLYQRLGMIYREKGQSEEAMKWYQKAEMNLKELLGATPNDFSVYMSLGHILCDQEKIGEAVDCYRKALVLEPNSEEAYYSMGDTLHETGQIDEAIECFQKAIDLNPEFSDAYNNLGILLRYKERFNEALECFRKALKYNTKSFRALNNLGNFLSEQGKMNEAESCYRKSLFINPSQSFVRSNLLLAMHYNPRYDAEMIYLEHINFANYYAKQFYPTSTFYVNKKSPDRCLKIGYVSPDFKRHSVAYFIEPVLAGHKRDCFEVFCYSDVERKDEFTLRMQGLADQWRDIAGFSDEKVAELIHDDKIDILVDLAGHTAQNRMLLFARKPAPVQVSWIGYPSTTGVSTIDYKLVDDYTDPEGLTEEYYTETLFRLPNSFLCYMPDENIPQSTSLATKKEEYITFGSFNNFAKVSDTILLLWKEILKEIPTSHLLIKAKGLSDERIREDLLRFFKRYDIDTERIEMHPWIPSISEHLALYQQIDIAFDTYPYHGTTTTCEALLMGVPVVTLAGRRHASRVGASILSNVGMPELVADTKSEYKRIAIGLANDLGRLQHLRKTLRKKIMQSPLCDANHFVKNLEKAFREMWLKWCQKIY